MKADIQVVFFDLLKAGLWEHDVELQQYGDINFTQIFQLAKEQSIVGILAAGIDRLKLEVPEFKIPKESALQFIGQTLQIEQRNRTMNEFVAKLINILREQGVYALLVKGQGIAQCYDRPLWRTAGDIDLLLSESNYEKAKNVLLPLASRVETEYTHFKHQGMTIDGWEVELHETMHSRLSSRVDKMIDKVQKDVFYYGKVRSIEFKDQSGRSVQVFAPAPDEDVIFVFTHILHHFFLEGVGLRQICDWCRLLWTYREKLDHKLLESRLRKAGLMSEWKAFAAFAVDWLGMPVEAMPLYSQDKKWSKKGERICRFVMEVGNFGHNKVRQSSREGKDQGYFRRKFVSSYGRLTDMLRHFTLFPLDSIRFFGGVLRSGLHAAVRGE